MIHKTKDVIAIRMDNGRIFYVDCFLKANSWNDIEDQNDLLTEDDFNGDDLVFCDCDGCKIKIL